LLHRDEFGVAPQHTPAALLQFSHAKVLIGGRGAA
jgi:hypothetical protein